MRTKTIITGIILILLGIGSYVYYDFFIKPDKAAKMLLTEGEFVYERGDKASINGAIDIYTKILVNYPDSKYVAEAYYRIARCYERLGLHRLAYLKYIYLIKSGHTKIDGDMRKEILVRLAHINVLKQNSEEAVSQLYSLLNTNYNKEFRSKIYSELGYINLKQRDYKKAKRMFDISLTEYGSNEEAIIGQARALKWMGRDSEAYDLYESFLKYYGAVSQYAYDVRKAYRDQAYNSGLSAFRSGRYGAAISFFNRILTNFPGDKISENAFYWAGESYYGMGEFDKAVLFFNKALSNGFSHKDEDARIKKGCSYFAAKKFDLAARDFQMYLQYYPRGKYASIAANWKEMSTKELLFSIQNKKLPEARDVTRAREEKLKEAPKNQGKDDELEEDTGISEKENDEEISGDYNRDALIENGIEVENVAEL